jgi:nascent polypeptide-associated complex subunit alpha
MPSVAEELAALRDQGVTKKNADKLKDANGLSTPEAAQNAIKAEQERLRKANYGKEADSNLKSYNEAKSGGAVPVTASAPSSSTTPTPAPAPAPTPTNTSISKEENPFIDDDNDDDDDIPDLDEVPDLEEIPSLDGAVGGYNAPAAAAIANNAQPKEINRAERKARRMMEKLNMKKCPGITQCILKIRNSARGGGGVFTIVAPDCYVSNNRSSYVVFGEARQGGGRGVPGAEFAGAQQAAIQQLAELAKSGGGIPGAGDTGGAAVSDIKNASNNDSLRIEEINDGEEVVDESGVDKKDIDLCVMQAGCSRSDAVKALKSNDGDLVNAIMSLTA